MADDSSPGERKPGPSSDETVVQPVESAHGSERLSLPSDAQQNPEAPRVPGYILTAPMGRGAFAQVWKAWQTRTRKQVAVKLFIQRTGVNWIYLQREVERLIKLDKHAHIVSLLDADLTAEPPYYVMDLLEGGSLEEKVSGGRPVEPAQAVRWLEEICAALSYVHSKGLIHCDLKPANVLLDESGHVRVADFGQSRIVTESSGALGTLFYMAPEQAFANDEAGELHPDVRWDIFAVGTTLYALLTGTIPRAEFRERLDAAKSLKDRLKIYRGLVEGQPLRDCAELSGGKVDEDLSAILGKCFHPEPDSRYRTIAEISADLSARAERRPVSPLLGDRGYRARRYFQRNALFVAAGAALVAGTAFSLRQALRARNQAVAQLSTSYVARARQLASAGEDAAAALYFAEALALRPSHLSRANSAAQLKSLAVPLRLLLHNWGVWELAVSPDGRRVLTGGWENAARLWDARTGAAVGPALSHSGSIHALAFSPDGRWAATGGGDKQARLWSSETGEAAGRRAMAHDGEIVALAFSPDNRRLLTGTANGAARLWTVPAGEPDSPVLRHGESISAAAFSPDGRAILTAGEDGRLRVWDAATGKLRLDWPGHRKAVADAAFSPDGAFIVSAGRDGAVRIWEARSGAPAAAPPAHANAINCLALDRRGELFATGDTRGEIRLWNALTGKPIHELRTPRGAVEALAFSPDGRLLASGGEDGQVRYWETAGGAELGPSGRHENVVRALAFSPDGRRLYSTGDDGITAEWEVPAPAKRRESLEHPGLLSALAFSPDGTVALSAGEDGTARLWDAGSGLGLGVPLRHGGAVAAAAFSPDGKKIATAGKEGSIRLWETRGGGLLHELAHGAAVAALAFSPDGERLASGGLDEFVRLWDPAAGKAVGAPLRQGGPVLALAFSPDGKLLLSGAGQEARLWDAAAGEARGAPLRHGDWISAVAFSPDGQKALTAAWDNEAQFWDIRRCARPPRRGPLAGFAGRGLDILGGERDWGSAARCPRIGKVLRHGADLSAASFSPDGRRAATASWDGTARLWDARDGSPAGPPLRHEKGVSALAFSPDGRSLATGSWDRTVRLWDAAAGEALGKPIVLPGKITRLSFSPDGLSLLAGGSEGGARLLDLSWLARQEPARSALPKARLASRRKIGAGGELEPLSPEELGALAGGALK